ncbi:MAG: hypothetical protein AB9903_06540 [Vulcanimicrobiota bacterium]
MSGTPLNEKSLTSIKLEYPFPLAYTYISMKNAEESKAKLDKSIEVLESIVKYLAIISAQSFLREPLGAEHATFMLSFLPRPSLGTWNALLREVLSSHHSKPEDLFVPEIYHFYFKSNRKVSDNAKIIDDLINERNKIAHGGAPATPKDCDAKVAEVQPKLEDLLFNLSFLRDYDLLHLRYSKKDGDIFKHTVKVCMGAMSQFENKDLTTSSSENSNHVYLHHRERNALLDLHPFIIYTDRFEGARAPELFFYNKTSEPKIQYINYQSGQSFNDSEYSADLQALTEKLTSYTKARDVKYDEYRKLAAEVWKFGAITPADEERLRTAREERAIEAEEASRIEEEVKTELFAGNMEDLIALLKTPEKRSEASATLFKTGARSIPFLIEALGDSELHEPLGILLVRFGSESLTPLLQALENDTLRDGARHVLKRMPQESLPLLLSSLEKEEEAPSIEETLILFREASVQPLIELLRTREQRALDGGMKLVSLKEDRLWIRAKRILKSIGKPAAECLVLSLDDPLTGETQASILADMGGEAEEALVKALSEERLTSHALRLLKLRGTSAITVILKEAGERKALGPAAEEFILSFGTDALPSLADALKAGVSPELVTKIMSKYPAESPGYLVPLLRNEELSSTVEALLRESGSHAVAPLVKALGDQAVGDRAEILLKAFPPSDVINAILDEMTRKEKVILDSSSFAGKVESHARNILKDLSKSTIFGSVLESVKIDPGRIEQTVSQIRDPFTKRAFSLIGAFEPAELSLLVDSFTNDKLSDFIRLALASAGEKAVPVILERLPGLPETAQKRCSIILSDIGAPAASRLIDVLSDPALQAAAADALSAMGPEAVPDLAKALINEENRGSLLQILKNIGPAGYKNLLSFLAVPVIGDVIGEFMQNAGSAAVPALIDGLEESPSRECAMRILGRMEDNTYPLLIDALKREKIAAPVRDLLKSSGPEVIPLLFEKLRSESGGVGSIIKSIMSFAKGKEAGAPTPVRIALMECTAFNPEPLVDICAAPRNRDIAFPVLMDGALYLFSHTEIPRRDDNLQTIKSFVHANSQGVAARNHMQSQKEYPVQVVQGLLQLMEI